MSKKSKHSRRQTVPDSHNPVVRRGINLPLLMATVVLVCIVVTGGYFWHARQEHNLADTLLDRADVLEAESQYRQAADYIFRYLKLRPDDILANIRLAETFDQSASDRQQKIRAITLFYRAIGLGPDEEQARLRRRLIELLLETRRFVEAESEAATLLNSEQHRSWAQRNLAWALVEQYRSGQLAGKRDKSRIVGVELEKAVADNPHDMELCRAWAEILRSEIPLLSEKQKTDQWPTAEARAAEADRVVNAMVAGNAENPDAYTTRFLYRRRFADDEASRKKAMADLSKALELGPDSESVNLIAGAHFESLANEIQNQNEEERKRETVDLYQKAIGYYKTVIEVAEQLDATPFLSGYRVYRSLDELQASDNLNDATSDDSTPNNKLAEKMLTDGLEKVDPLDASLNLQLAEFMINRGRLDEAREALDKLDQQEDKFELSGSARLAWNRIRDLLEAKFQLADGNPIAAIELTRPIVTSTAPEDQRLRAWQMLGQAFADLGHWDQSAHAYENVMQSSVTTTEQRWSTAMSWLKAGQPKNAIGHLQQVYSTLPSLEVALQLASAHLQFQSTRPDPDWKALEQLLERLKVPEEESQFEKPWRIDLLKADYLTIQANQARSGDSNTPSTAHQKMRDDAIALLRNAEKRNADDPALHCQLVLRYERLDEPHAADEALKRCRSNSKFDPAIELVAARLMVLRKQHAKARQIIESAVTAGSESDQLALRLGLVQVYMAEGNLVQARLAVNDAWSVLKSDATRVGQLGEVLITLADPESSAEWEQTLRDIEGTKNGTLWRYLKARRLIANANSTDSQQIREAAQLQDEIQRLRPSWSAGYVLRGTIEEVRGDPESAVRSYKTAIDFGERRAGVIQRLVLLLNSLGDFNNYDEIESYLNLLEQFIPSSDSLSSLAIAIAGSRDDLDRATQLARQAVAARPEDSSAWLQLGRVLATSEKPGEAENAFQRAIQIAPGTINTWLTLFGFHLQREQPADARATLEELGRRQEISAAQRAFALAQGYEMLGEADLAAEKYGEAAKLEADNIAIKLRQATFLSRTDPDAAIDLLKNVMSLADQQKLDDAADQARRLRATLLAARGKEDDFDEAISLLQQSGSEDEEQLDKRLQAILLAKRTKPDLDRAAELLTELTDGPGGEPGDHVFLARVLQRQSESLPEEARAEKLKEARDLYEEVCRRPNARPAHIRQFVGLLLDQQEFQQADWWMRNKLLDDEAAQHDIRTLNLRIRYLTDPASNAVPSRQDRMKAAKAEIEQYRQRALSRFEQESGDPEDTETKVKALRFLLGQIYASHGMHREAEQEFRSGYGEDPQLYRHLADSLAQQGKVVEAIELCQNQQQDTNSPKSAVILASVLVSSPLSPSDFSLAEPILTDALSRFPDDPNLCLAVANFYVAAKRDTNAIQLYRQVLDQNPKHAVALNNLATLLSERSGKADEALKYINRAIDMLGEIPALLDTKGMILLHDNRSTEAVALLERAAASPRADPRFHFHLAAALHRAGNPESAQQKLNHALDRGLNNKVLTNSDRTLLKELEGKEGVR